MAKLTEMLQQRFRKKQDKMEELAEKRAEGQLTVFSGVFRVEKLGEKESEELRLLLLKFAPEGESDVSADLHSLMAITSEVKAINNQAAILHGERIKQAQTLLKNYRDGAFTAWLTATYGNRQTPYNFLQYYDFYTKIPKALHPQVESMPRQAVYTLASRDGSFSKKEEIVRNYQGETKQEMLALIRTSFPLDEGDRRRENGAENACKLLEQALHLLEKHSLNITTQQKMKMEELLTHISSLIRR